MTGGPGEGSDMAREAGGAEPASSRNGQGEAHVDPPAAEGDSRSADGGGVANQSGHGDGAAHPSGYREAADDAASKSAGLDPTASTTSRSGSVAGAAGRDGTVDPGNADHDDAERNEGSMNSVEGSKDFEQFHDDLDAVERRMAGEIDPGVRAMVVAGAVFVLLLSLVLPHAGTARGFDVLLGTDAARFEHIGLPSRVFVWLVVVFGIGFSLLALMTRRWVLAWIAAAGSAVGSVFGIFSIWHRQTPGVGGPGGANYHGAGPGIGLIIGAIAVIVLTFHWIRVVWSRTTLQLAAEEQRRIAAAAAEERDRRRFKGEN